MTSGEAVIALLLAVTMIAAVLVSIVLLRQYVAGQEDKNAQLEDARRREADEHKRAEYWQSKAIAALLCDARLRAQLEAEGYAPVCMPPGLNGNDEDVRVDALAGILETMFTLEELEHLCFEVGINYEDLGGDVGLETKVSRLINYAKRRGMDKRLRAAVQKARPNARL